MKWQAMSFLMTTMVLLQSPTAMAAETGDEGNGQPESYSQLTGSFGITSWELGNAGFLQTNTGLEGYSAHLGWISNFPLNRQWAFAMGFGLDYQIARIDVSKRSGESFPQPFEFDQPQAVDGFGINYYTFSIPLKVRCHFSKSSNFFVETGPEPGVLSNLNYAHSEGNKTTSYHLDEAANRFNLAWDLGVGYDFDWNGDRWAVGLKGFYQLTPVLDDSDLEMTPRGARLFLRFAY